MSLERSLVSCIIRIPGQGEILRRLRAVQEQFARQASILPHPSQFLHITIRLLGRLENAPRGGAWVKDIEGDAVDIGALAEGIQDALQNMPSFPIHLYGLNAFPEALFVQVWDGGAIAELRRRIQSVAPFIDDRYYPGGFVPHLSIAYFPPGAPLAGMVDRVRASREENFGSFFVEAVELVVGEDPGPHPTLKTIQRFPLIPI